MKRAGRVAITMAVLTCGLRAQSRLAAVIDAVDAEVKQEAATEYMRELYARDRWFTFSKFEEGVRYLAKVMNGAGLSKVEVVGAPADGVTQVGYWTMPLAWDVKEARLEVVEPSPPGEFQVLGDFQKAPASLCMWSGPTPPGGVTAEVVDIGEGRQVDVEKLDLTGRIALTSRRPTDIKWLLAKKGALGVINTFTENPDLKDAYDWVNSWGDKGWGLVKGDSKLFCFSITRGNRHGCAGKWRTARRFV